MVTVTEYSAIKPTIIANDTNVSTTITIPIPNPKDYITIGYTPPAPKETRRRMRCECCDALLPLKEVKAGVVQCEFCGAVQDSEDIIKD